MIQPTCLLQPRRESDADAARTVVALLALWERFEPLAPYPAWAVGVAVVALIGGACALAACLIRRGPRRNA